MNSTLLLSLFYIVFLSSEIEAWSPQNLSKMYAPRHNSRTIQHPIRHSSFPSLTKLQLKFIDSSSEDNSPKLVLSPDEDDAIRSVAKTLSTDDRFGAGWFDRAEAWAAAKDEFPVLEQYDDADLREAFLKQKPRVLDLLTDTPLGPFLLINLIAKFSGFTWCDTPFGQAEACLPK